MVALSANPIQFHELRVRGFLAEDYGVDIASVRWIIFEDAHLAEYRDPSNVEHAPEGAKGNPRQDLVLLRRPR